MNQLIYLFMVLVVIGYLWKPASRVPLKLGLGPKLIVSVGEDNPKTNPAGPTTVQLTITDQQGENLRHEKAELVTPHTKVFQLNPGEIVAQLDVQTPDQMDHRLRYPKLNSNLKLDNYYANWYGDPDSKWTETWCNQQLTGSD